MAWIRDRYDLNRERPSPMRLGHILLLLIIVKLLVNSYFKFVSRAVPDLYWQFLVHEWRNFSLTIGFCRCMQIGNCVGAANHRSFIFFLISAVISTIYVSIISAYAAYQIWPPLSYTHLSLLSGPVVVGGVKEILLAFFTSVQFLPVRGFVLVYLVIASISVEIGLSMLLWQQLCYIYEGKTYLSHLSLMGSDEIVKRDCQNIVRFFSFPFSAWRFVPSSWNSKKSHKK